MKLYEDQLIVITGGVGFIGSCLTAYLNSLGIKNLVLVDNLGTSDKWKNLVGKNVADVLDKSQLFEWLQGKESQIEAIVHLGACSTTVEPNASYLLENNYRYSVRLAEYALKNDIRFIYASSAATYGDGSQGFSDRHDLLELLHPLNMYGLSKQLFDLWAKEQGALKKITGLKFFNVFGPNEAHKGRMASAITHMYPAILKDGCIRLFKSNDPEHFGDGEQKRDFVYVKDVVRMIHAFLLNDAAGIFNIASGRPSTWNELAKSVFKALNMPVNIEYIPMPLDLAGKYQNYTCADMSKTVAELKEAANCRSLEAAVDEYLRNYLIPGRRW